jgi:PAS domain S-box-containing protein
MVETVEPSPLADGNVSAELLSSAFEATTVGMAIVDASGCIAIVNEPARRMFGYSRTEMLGCSIERLVPERYRTGHVAFRQAFQRTPSTRSMGAGRDLYARRKDGTEFPVEIGLQPIGDEPGKLVLATIVDITERRRLQDRFRMVVENAPNAIVMVDRGGAIVLVNAQAQRVFGYSREEMLSLSVDMLVPKRFRDAHPAFRGGFFARPDARPMGAGRDLYALRKDGEEFPVEIGLVPIDTDEGTMVLSAIVDITERKQREANLQAALHEKELLLGEVHHRVKNNLQIIDSLLSLQARRVGDSEVRAALSDSQNRIRSMALIHQMLYQTRDFAFVDFNGFLMALLPRLVESITAERDRIKVHIAAEKVQLPINLAIPCGLIVNELVTNALKHAFPDGRRGTIHVELSRHSKAELEVVVGNDGAPIPSTFSMGTGETLGVQLVSLLAQQMQGSVVLEREPLTRFRVRFPYPTAEGLP